VNVPVNVPISCETSLLLPRDFLDAQPRRLEPKRAQPFARAGISSQAMPKVK